MKKIALLFCLLFIFKPAYSKVKKIELIGSFLAEACQPDPRVSGWKKYLKKSKVVLRLLSEFGYEPKEIESLDQQQVDIKQVCKQARILKLSLPETLNVLEKQVTKIFSQGSSATVYMAVLPVKQDIIYRKSKFQDEIILNVGHPLFDSQAHLHTTLLSFLFRSAHYSLHKFKLPKMNPLVRGLYTHGVSAESVSYIYPEVGLQSSGLSLQRIKELEEQREKWAREFLKDLKSKNSTQLYSKYFTEQNGGPSRFVGRYLGHLITHELAEIYSPEKALSLAPDRFEDQALIRIEKWAKGLIK